MKLDKPPKCFKCLDTGFSWPGQICECITGKHDDKMPELPPELRAIFGQIFKGE